MRTRSIVAIVTILAAISAATTAAAVQALSSHRERFTISGKTIRGKEGPIKVLATGPIDGTGTIRFVEHGNTSNGAIHLPDGKVFITFTGTRFVSHPHPRACTGTFEYDGTYTIHGGTRLYRHATGNGTFTEQRKYMGQRDKTGHCLPQAPPAIITAVNHAHGTATLRAN
jgi:hypothetical protein